MFMNADRFKTQINAYSKLIAGTVFLLHEEFGSGLTRSRRFGDEIADEIIKLEIHLAKVGFAILREKPKTHYNIHIVSVNVLLI